ncbi:type VII secretion-associated serine protease mycosin [Nocardia tengchongensis]|uniref:type VII secretion-associated serine protease mycosin n=1 Tax=Nocardia tengchongensis TaxID=2055889 RepID=UPI0036CE14A6
MSRRPGNWARTLCAAAILGGALLGPQVSAEARPVATVNPPTSDPGTDEGRARLKDAQDKAGKPGPLVTTELKVVCGNEWYLKSKVVPRDEAVAQKVLDLPAVWQANPGPGNKGAGQTIAVIDTGVIQNPRLDVRPGGDFVSGSDGTEDCDGHGTAVAGIIAAKPSPDDALVGVAPEAQILAIRQFSDHYQAKDQNGEKPPGTMSSQGYGPSLTLAAAVVHAVDLGAKTINISEAACTAGGSDTGDGPLGAAVRYAYDNQVVVVVAAGNLDQATGCGTQNGSYSDNTTSWKNVKTVSSPAWFNKYVLSVGWIQPDGNPAGNTLYGPWVGVAAIGQDLVSLDSKTPGALVNGTGVDKDGKPIGLNGTSFAAPQVAGLAALLRAKYPDWSARQIMNQIILTAHQPGTGRDDRVGAGLIDPVAALTAHFPDDVLSADTPVLPNHAGSDKPLAFPTPEKPAGPPRLPRLVATVGTIVCLSALGIGLAVSIPFRRRRSDDELPDLDY